MAKVGSYRWEGQDTIRRSLDKAARWLLAYTIRRSLDKAARNEIAEALEDVVDAK